jgi:hypothetical protein
VSVTAFQKFLSDYRGGREAESVHSQSEASCFYHSDKRAEQECSYCGRLLCGLCDLALHDQHLCPSCFEKGRDSQDLEILKKGYTHYDRMALNMTVGLFLFSAIPIMGIIAALISVTVLVVMIRKYKQAPASLLPRRRWRFFLAVLICIAHVVVSIGFSSLTFGRM